MKRVLVYSAVIFLLLTALAACGAGTASTAGSSADPMQEPSTPAETSAPITTLAPSTETPPSPTPSPSTDPEPTPTAQEVNMDQIKITFNGCTYTATLADNSSAKAFAELLGNGPLTLNLSDYGNFEKVGPIGTSLPQNNEQITTVPGDLILYQGDKITIYYAQNSWSFTRLGKLDGDLSHLKSDLGKGDVTVTFALNG